MITEDYVSFEIAKLLKEKGFDEPCHALYHDGEDKIFFGLDVDSYYNSILNVDCYTCPTLQMAMKWLREVHNLFIEIMVGDDDGKIWYDFDVINIGKKDIPTVPIDNIVELETYEEASETAIKYCLEVLI